MLVNNAGINIRQDAFDVTEEAWDKVIDTDLKGVFFMAQAVGRRHARSGPAGRRYRQFASVMGLGGYFQRSAYCSAKAGVVNLTKVLALEWAPVNIRVNAVCPDLRRYPAHPSDVRKPARCLRGHHLPHAHGTARHLRGSRQAVAFLCGPESSYVNGLPLTVDGGWTAT